jgi:predicted transposase YdaD
MTHKFNVIRLWEQPTDIFLTLPGLLPFAALSNTENSADVLQQVAQVIEEMPNKQEQSNIAASSTILAGLVLNRNFIQRVLRKDIMRESTMYQYIKAEGVAEVIFRLLKRKIGNVSPELQATLPELSVETLENLAEALLDFSTEADLQTWLQTKSIDDTILAVD